MRDEVGLSINVLRGKMAQQIDIATKLSSQGNDLNLVSEPLTIATNKTSEQSVLWERDIDPLSTVHWFSDSFGMSTQTVTT